MCKVGFDQAFVPQHVFNSISVRTRPHFIIPGPLESHFDSFCFFQNFSGELFASMVLTFVNMGEIFHASNIDYKVNTAVTFVVKIMIALDH